MNAVHLREQLHTYINQADTKKLKAIYTILEKEIHPQTPTWPDEWLKELDMRAEESDSEQVKGMTLDEVIKTAESHLRRQK
jgi:hypothetical protein